MKLFSSILILLLLFLGGPGWGQCSKKGDCSNSKLNWKTDSGVQSVILQGSFLDVQDTNDIDGPDGFVLNPTLTVNPYQYIVNTVNIVLPFTFQAQINTFLIDLPPPSFS